MRPNYSIDDLNIDIKLLELRQKQEWLDLRDDIELTKENLKPMKILSKSLSKIGMNDSDSKSILSSVASIGMGYLSKKLFVGKTTSKTSRFLGSMLELAVTNFMTKKTAVENNK